MRRRTWRRQGRQICGILPLLPRHYFSSGQPEPGHATSDMSIPTTVHRMPTHTSMAHEQSHTRADRLSVSIVCTLQRQPPASAWTTEQNPQCQRSQIWRPLPPRQPWHLQPNLLPPLLLHDLPHQSGRCGAAAMSAPKRSPAWRSMDSEVGDLEGQATSSSEGGIAHTAIYVKEVVWPQPHLPTCRQDEQRARI